LKSSSDKGRRIRVYLIVLAVMIVTGIATAAIATKVAVKYMNGSAGVEESGYYQSIERFEMESLVRSMQRASFGYYYLFQKNKADYSITPSNVFGKAEDTGEQVTDFGNIIYDEDNGSSVWMNETVEREYSEFLKKLRDYDMHYCVENLADGGHLSDADLSPEQCKKKAETGGFYLEAEIDKDGSMEITKTDKYYTGEMSEIDRYDIDDLPDVFDVDAFQTYPARMKFYIYSDNTGFYDSIISETNANEYFNYKDNILREGFWYPWLVLGIMTVTAAWLLMTKKSLKLREGFLVKIPLAGVLAAAGAGCVLFGSMADGVVNLILSGNGALAVLKSAGTALGSSEAGYSALGLNGFRYFRMEYFILTILAVVGMEILFFVAAGGIYSLALLGPKTYLKEKTLVWRLARWIKREVVRFFDHVARMAFDARNHRTLVKVLLVNFVVVSLLCCCWFFGIIGAVIYTIAAFIISIRFLDRIKAEYDMVARAVRDMAEGHLNTDMSDDAGAFESIHKDLASVREGVKLAVAEEVKSQKMKTELITNVSHDLKTPLTAIITYTNLLKDEHLSEEDRRHYVEILDQKAERLKRLIEDLFEVSKANSRNIQVNKTWLDLSDLVRQATVENEDKLKNAEIDLRLSLPGGKTMLELDGQKVYRMMDNLLGNVAKYSLPGTRAWVSVEDRGKEVLVTVKNISASELPEDVDSLTDRFVRGDKSRNTEGSGLGLAIVKSFAELMDGSFELCVDGDLFKAVVTFYRNDSVRQEVSEENAAQARYVSGDLPETEFYD